MRKKDCSLGWHSSFPALCIQSCDSSVQPWQINVRHDLREGQNQSTLCFCSAVLTCNHQSKTMWHLSIWCEIFVYNKQQIYSVFLSCYLDMELVRTRPCSLWTFDVKHLSPTNNNSTFSDTMPSNVLINFQPCLLHLASINLELAQPLRSLHSILWTILTTHCSSTQTATNCSRPWLSHGAASVGVVGGQSIV